jgi:outer membrane lipoprotein SlyB
MAQLLRLFALLFTAVLLASCADHPVRESTRVDYGYVESLQVYRAADNKPIDVGTVLGGIAGGIIGHQIGSGSGQTAATIAGAIGGAILGHHVERKVSGSRYRVTVRLDSASTLVVDDTRDVDLRVGDRVRVENDRVRRV